MDLVYDLEGNFLYGNTEIPSDDLPITLIAIINRDYPGYVIATVYEQKWTEETKYEIKLGGKNDSLELIVLNDGSVIFESAI